MPSDNPSPAGAGPTDRLLISVVIATRDRPTLFGQALQSVLDQVLPAWASLEVVVVNDGGASEHLPAYQDLWRAAQARLGPRLQVHTLVHRPRGHGQSYSLNFGVAQAQGSHVCFLDDDDYWVDNQHLGRLASAVAAARDQGEPLDLYMANQDAWLSNGQRVGTLWLGDLAAQLTAQGVHPDPQGLYACDLNSLMEASGFCHLNCLGVRRGLWNDVGGMDEGIRWECDRDLYLKLVEAARCIRHHPAVVAYHRVPDPAKSVNMTTSLSMVDKRVLQNLVMDKALSRSRHPAVQRHARRHKAWALQKLAQEHAARGDWPQAGYYARQALGAAPGLRWAWYTVQASLRGLQRPPRPQ